MILFTSYKKAGMHCFRLFIYSMKLIGI